MMAYSTHSLLPNLCCSPHVHHVDLGDILVWAQVHPAKYQTEDISKKKYWRYKIERKILPRFISAKHCHTVQRLRKVKYCNELGVETDT